MGVLNDGTWVVKELTGLRILNSPQSYLRVKVLLEQPISKIREQINAFFKVYNIIVDVDSVFPFVELVRSVLDDGITYWTELAFYWYDELSLESKLSLKDALLKVDKIK